MPHKQDVILTTPPDERVLWRYLDFAKFVSVIEQRSLWFSRVDKFEDPLDGTWTDNELACTLKAFGETNADAQLEGSRWEKAGVFASCWRQGDHESMAMWDLYGRGSGAVAIKSTVGRLREAFANDPNPVYIAEIKYQCWSEPSLWVVPSPLFLCARKDKSYEHEAEVRALIWAREYKHADIPPEAISQNIVAEKLPTGISFPIDPALFITEVVIGPREQRLMRDLVEAVLRRYGLHLRVTESNRLRAR